MAVAIKLFKQVILKVEYDRKVFGVEKRWWGWICGCIIYSLRLYHTVSIILYIVSTNVLSKTIW